MIYASDTSEIFEHIFRPPFIISFSIRCPPPIPPKNMNPPTLNVAMMTSGGLAPCLSSSIASLVWSYAELGQPITLRFYHSGYKGILTGTSTYIATVPSTGFDALHAFGGSPLGSSRVKLTNVADCLKRGYIKGAETPLSVAAAQLKVDNVDVLHTIGGDDTNTQAAELSFFLKEQGYGLTVVGMPKVSRFERVESSRVESSRVESSLCVFRVFRTQTKH